MAEHWDTRAQQRWVSHAVMSLVDQLLVLKNYSTLHSQNSQWTESNFGVTLTNNVTNNTADLTFWPCCITAQHKWLSCALCRVLHHDNHCQLQQRMQACKLIGHVLYIEPFHWLFIYKIQIDLLMFMALAASSNRSVCIFIFRLFFKTILWNFHIFAYMIELTIISLLLLAKVT